jgi:glycerol uptake facilitator-like aquaporin
MDIIVTGCVARSLGGRTATQAHRQRAVIRRLAAEALGTALLLAIVVGSGIMGERLAAGNAAVALLANTLATGAGLFVLISIFAPISGAHFNPAVTLAALLDRTLSVKQAFAYIAVQFGAAWVGVIAAHAMFALPLLQTSAHARPTLGEGVGEIIATFGLLLTIKLCSRAPLPHIAAAVALWITAAYWFTSSTSFANPAVTFARSLTDTFAGIAPADVLPFVGAQLAGAAVAVGCARWLLPDSTRRR